ncbi:MAG: FtsW/RodA/SpoVE family cell cycle protein [Eubacteriales bacterium]|nr:FtsW/RodA/SpoVE family cell cycle protein [Eubacteriales bacterium]
MEAVKEFLQNLPIAFQGFTESVREIINTNQSIGILYTAIARWVFIFLAIFILVKSIKSLLQTKNPSEVWAYLHLNTGENIPITHWENVIGRAKSADILIDDRAVSRNHGTLSRDFKGKWKYTDLGSKNGAMVDGITARPNKAIPINPGDKIVIGFTELTLFPISVEERQNNIKLRKEDTRPISPWPSLIALSIFQAMTVIQLMVALKDQSAFSIAVSFAFLSGIMWFYVITLRTMRRKGFEMETIAFFLSTLSLAVTASKYPDAVLKQFIAIALGVVLFFGMCVFLRNLERAKAMRNYLMIGAVGLLIFNLAFGTLKYGAANWVELGGISFQPSELVKIAFVWIGAASLDELFQKKNLTIFMIFSGFCLGCLALMGDFGTAMIFFVTYLIISFLRSGDFSKLVLIVGAAGVAGLMVLKFKSYIADRFAAWGHVWEYADSTGYQQTRTMCAAGSGGFVGVGAGNGWLNTVSASDTDLVFGLITEEWGLIIAVLAVISIITLSIFAVNSIMAGRSTFYTIGACSAMSMFLFQTALNVFGSVDLFPLTGVTFPFVSNGGTSMLVSWGLLAFLKAADTRQNASVAISLKDKGMSDPEMEESARGYSSDIDSYSDEMLKEIFGGDDK